MLNSEGLGEEREKLLGRKKELKMEQRRSQRGRSPESKDQVRS